MTPDKVEAALGVFKDAIRYEVRAEADPGWIAEMREALSVLTEALAERGWRPIESAPLMTWGLFFHPNFGDTGHPKVTVEFTGSCLDHKDDGYTHWQPLPEPPHAR